MGKEKQAPFRENGHVRELLAVMKENRMDTRDLRELLSYVGAMERQLDAAVAAFSAPAALRFGR